MRVFYTPRYYAEIGEGHIFPIRKFELVRDRLMAEGTLEAEALQYDTRRASDFWDWTTGGGSDVQHLKEEVY